MRIGIIGAGITGMSIARLLGTKHDVEILERESSIGGIAKIKPVNGIPYHMVGGHCMSLKNVEVKNFVYEVLPKENWHEVIRKAKISFKEHLIDYPIEFSIREIAKFDEELAYRMSKDFLASCERSTDNLEDWLRVNFGETIADEYLIPYNEKIWGRPPSEICPSWVSGKLPIPNKKQFFKSLIGDQKDTMPHAVFNYPDNNVSNMFIEAMGSGLNITKEYCVKDIKRSGKKWIVNGEKIVDLLISTMPLNVLPHIIADTPDDVVKAAARLKYNKISNIIWETDEVDATWTYYPDPKTIFHRHIHIGNFLNPKSNYTITEVLGERPRSLLEKEGSKIAYLRKPVDYHVSDHAYVVFDHNFEASVNKIKSYLTSIGIHTLGRFGEWEYYNMDVCIQSAMRLANKLQKLK